uniref:Synapse-associated protein 1-like n=1 Tax=Callorhinchus milii TaxID=7868 RepID=A0A4W3JSP9_CALMI
MVRERTRVRFRGPGEDLRQMLKIELSSLVYYLYNAASSATKKVSESVRGTAQTIKKSVEERKIDDLFNKTIIGDFKKEQEKFVKEKKSKKSGSTLPPWAGYIEEESIRQQILSLSADRRNFLRDPPAGVQFNFEFDRIAPVAMVMLREDELLNKVRFDLVPKLVKEEQFWRNYFYRVSLIKQSAELSLLAAQHTGRSKRKEDPLEDRTSATGGSFISTSLIAAEFASDAYHTLFPKQDNLLEGMEMLGMSADDIPEWEKELQRELQEFEIVEGSEQINDAWEKEIEEMLEAAADSKG